MTPIKRVDPLEFIFSWVQEDIEEDEGCDEEDYEPEYYNDLLE